ncbi:DUF4783 domain-containing protein [Mucilaginibacter terrenus]|uniref:DUF4783 domain-containing protein n=1 Tax=Mucilaginibacter terrenus TaxID=2482727 RepID=A0A3E2NX82_9SPHI|nr:DUF4783 domain-containing protein [Mucilaginibacter terrenus]RFZ85634.1 DUF4783 domain-containing protein [Mucilaginibacter terrenus]
MKLLTRIPLLILLFTIPAAAIAGPIDKVAELIKQGNTHELAKLFAATIDVTVLENANVYSKAQAEIILEKFFKENRPQSVKIIHRVNSSAAYNFEVMHVVTDKGKYRVAVTMKEIEKQMVIIELRVEVEKT